MNPKQIRVGLLSLLALFAMALDVSAQKRTVSGHVTDTEGVPMVGVGILVKGEGRGVISGQDGSWSISVSPENVLEFSLLGFQTQEITVGDRTVIDVRLELKANELDDVTVVAFAKQKKESIIASVSAVNPKELKIPSSNLTTALAGRVSGVISYQVSGEPGQDNAQFFVRGISSFGASAKKDPLILIDNIEMSSSDLARLTTDDIASFSVMKDATAAALYGARGANGVILITTKSGMEGKAKLNFRYETSISQPTREVEFADPVTYMSLHNEAVKTRNPIAPAPYSQEKIANTRLADRNTNVFPATDWYDMLFKPATVNQRFNFNLSGGGQISNYYISGAYTRDNGVLKSDLNNNFTNNINLNKYVLRANFNVNVTKSTKVTIRLHGAFDDYQGPLQGGSELYEMAMNANPVAFPAFYRTDDGILEPRKHTMFGTNDDNTYVNPYAEMVKGFKQYSSSTMLAQVEVRQDFSELITKGLSGRVLVNTDRYSYFDVRRESKPYFYSLATYDRDNGFYTVRSVNEGSNALSYTEGAKDVNSSLYMEAAIDYARKFKDRHNVTGLLVYTMQQRLYGNAGSLQKSLPYRNMGLAGRFTYDYDSRYFMEANFGYNGSERFNAKHRWGFFPSAGLGYIISNEKFWEPLKNTVSLLKLKATYGLVGNDAIGNERFFYLSNVDLNSRLHGISFGTTINTTKPGVSISQYANPEITWEISRKMNLGVELGLFDDLNVQFDYFTENRSNILMPRAYIPSTAGYEATISANIGEAVGHGCEVAVQYNHSFANGMWIMGNGNFTYATSEYKFYEEPDYADTPWLSHKGRSLGQVYGYVAERLFVDDAEVANSPLQNFGGNVPTQAGDIKYKDINNDGIISELDKVAIGYPVTPEIIYGFGVSLGYKGFDLSCFFQGSGRSSFWIDPAKVSPFKGGQRALMKSIADDVWTEENRNIRAFWPRLSEEQNANNSQVSTWFMRDGSFLRLKSAEFGYTIPDRLSKKLGINMTRIYLSGSNLLTFSKFKLWDPEMQGNGLGYPIQRVYNLGVHVTF